MSADAHAEYIIFAPVVVILSLAMANISLHPLASANNEMGNKIH